MTDKDLFLEPPEQILDIEEKSYDATWVVVGSNSRVVKNWRQLVSGGWQRFDKYTPISGLKP